MNATHHSQRFSYLHPGQFHFGSAPGHIVTLLGSCVAVTVWHPGARFDGMCHILLPSRKRPPGASPDARYADEAIERFIYALKARRLSPETCQVQLFGGGSMLSRTTAEMMNVGQRNIEATRAAITAHDFRVMTEHVGGVHPRRLLIDLSSGHVRMTLTRAHCA